MSCEPITSRARDLMGGIESALDAIDAVHAALEHENATLRERVAANKAKDRPEALEALRADLGAVLA